MRSHSFFSPKAGLGGAKYNNSPISFVFFSPPNNNISTTCHQKHKHSPNKTFFTSHISYVNAYFSHQWIGYNPSASRWLYLLLQDPEMSTCILFRHHLFLSLCVIARFISHSYVLLHCSTTFPHDCFAMAVPLLQQLPYEKERKKQRPNMHIDACMLVNEAR